MINNNAAFSIDTFYDVEQFHFAYNCAVRYRPELDVPEKQLRIELLKEELQEVLDAIESGDIREVAKELADLKYVTDGAALTFGIDLPRVFAEVHRSNMSKLDEDGKPIYREDGKVLKGPNYSPASLDFLLDRE